MEVYAFSGNFGTGNAAFRPCSADRAGDGRPRPAGVDMMGPYGGYYDQGRTYQDQDRGNYCPTAAGKWDEAAIADADTAWGVEWGRAWAC